MKNYALITALALSAFSIGILSCGNPYVIQSLQDQSTGEIPCPSDQIEIIQHNVNDDDSASWMALCEGRTYSCQREGGDSGMVTCSEMESQMPE